MRKRIDAYMEYAAADSFQVKELLELLDENQVERAVLVEDFDSARWNDMKQAVEVYPEKLALIPKVSMGEAALKGEAYWTVLDRIVALGRAVALDLGEQGFRSETLCAIGKITEAYPRQTFVLGHMAYATSRVRTDKAARAVWDELIELCRLHSNLRLDISNFGKSFSDEAFPYESGQRLIEEAIGYIGNNRFIWGSGAPAVFPYSSYGEALRILEEDYHIPELQKDGILYFNAFAVYFR
ncbi:MAG: amidohydrolase family protein [Bacillota bacterium]|nr:amidohydrolase family protein [Bacillota bacterium]